MGKLVNRHRTDPARQPTSRRATGPMIELEIVGESFHQDHIRALRRRYRDRDFEIVLVAEPENPDDRTAVTIYVDGGPVGHLSRELAADWQPMVMSANAAGFFVAGTASIWGGSADTPHLGVFGAAPWAGRTPAPCGRINR